MFPPKLAQILINISGAEKHVFDPFCGSGTVLQEAVLMGLNSSGTDISKEMVKDAKINMEWLSKITGKDYNYSLNQADARSLTSNQLPDENFTIVSETWLGPLLKTCPSPLELPKVQREIEDLYRSFFENLKKIVSFPISLVFTAPYHKYKTERHFLPNLPEILRLNTKIIHLSSHERPSLFYERKNQVVGREIWKVIIG